MRERSREEEKIGERVERERNSPCDGNFHCERERERERERGCLASQQKIYGIR